jgi:predicted nucleic acid-binding protein
MKVYVDATTLIALERVGELELLLNFDGHVLIPGSVADEIGDERAERNVEALLDADPVSLAPETESGEYDRTARAVLGEDETNGDVAIVAAVLRAVEQDESVAVVSDDRRVRTVAGGFDAAVTGTIGVVIRAVDEGMTPEAAKSLVRRLDSEGLHMTGELRETADRLIEETAEERD